MQLTCVFLQVLLYRHRCVNGSSDALHLRIQRHAGHARVLCSLQRQRGYVNKAAAHAGAGAT